MSSVCFLWASFIVSVRMTYTFDLQIKHDKITHVTMIRKRNVCQFFMAQEKSLSVYHPSEEEQEKCTLYRRSVRWWLILILWNYNQKQKSFIARCLYPVYLCAISRHFILKSYTNEILEMVIDKDKTWSSKSFLLPFFSSHIFIL